MMIFIGTEVTKILQDNKWFKYRSTIVEVYGQESILGLLNM